MTDNQKPMPDEIYVWYGANSRIYARCINNMNEPIHGKPVKYTRADLAQPVNQVMLEALNVAFFEMGHAKWKQAGDDKKRAAELVGKAIALAEQQAQDTKTIPNNWRELLTLSQNNFQHNFGMKPFKLGADWVYKDLEELFSSTGRYEHCVNQDTVAIPREVLDKVYSEASRAITLPNNSSIKDICILDAVNLLKPYVKGGE